MITALIYLLAYITMGFFLFFTLIEVNSLEKEMTQLTKNLEEHDYF
ncbi:MAG: hypothetical protein ACLFQK_08065 [Fibrobacterota bacterium]